MAGNSPSAARETFLGPLQVAVACVTDQILTTSGKRGAGDLQILALGTGGPVPVRGEARLGVEVGQRFRVVETDSTDLGPYKVQTAAYHYSLFVEHDPKFRFSYQWHPSGNSRIGTPHLHVRRPDGTTPAGHVHHKTHLPTGRISIEEFLVLIIQEFDVQPNRDDWQEVLTDSQARYEAYRTWAATSGPG